MRRISKVISIYFGIPISKLFVIVLFFARYIFLGWNDANDYLGRVSKAYIIPILRLFGAEIGSHCDIESGIRFHNCYNYKNLKIGNNCHIGKDCFFDLRGQINIGNNIVISMKTTIITHIDMSKSELHFFYPDNHEDVIIKDNCYIGVNTTILKGITIYNHSIIAAGSVVISDVFSNTIVGGVPAKDIKKI